MVEDQYLMTAKDINQQLGKYHKEIEHLLKFSTSVSKEVVKYVLKAIREDNNLEIGRILVEDLIANHATLEMIMKISIKILFVLHSTPRYSHGDYFTFKNYIDTVLKHSETTVAKLARKKYEVILNSILSGQEAIGHGQDVEPKNTADRRQKFTGDISDTINRQYIKFI